MSPISRLTGSALALTGAVLAVAAVAVVLLFANSSSSSAATTSVISARTTSLGTILVGPGGSTLYAFSRDGRDRDVCATIHGCLKVWPLVVSHGTPSAGHGVDRSRLGTIAVGGARQITYAGHPLYGYVDNGGPGDTSYVGVNQFGGSWPAVDPAGRLVH